MANTITNPIPRKDGAGQTVVQISSLESYHLVLDTANTGETSVAIINAAVWREIVILINVSALAGTTPQIIVNVWQLDNAGNRYPAPGAAPANNGVTSRSTTATGRFRDTVAVPIGAKLEITFNTGTSAGVFSSTTDIEVQLKSA